MERQSKQSRVFNIELDGAAKGDAIPLVISTDSVVDVSDGPEILVHTREAIDLRRAPLPIIATHRSGQISVGIVDELRVDEGKMRGVARFGSRDEAAGYKADVLNGTIRSVSVGYQRIKATGRRDGVLVTTRWMPTHTALVAEPADPGAGFFRERDDEPAMALTIEAEPEKAAAETTTTEPIAAVARSAEGTATAAPKTETTIAEAHVAPWMQARKSTARNAKESLTMDPKDTAAAGASAESKDPRIEPGSSQHNAGQAHEKQRIRAIDNLCKANKIDQSVREHWVGSGLGMDEITDDLLKLVEQRSVNVKPVTHLGLSARETQQFSLFRAVQAAADKNWSAAGFELECSRAIAKKMDKVVDPHTFFVPFDVMSRPIEVPASRAQRDMTVGTTTAGGFLVETVNVGFIEMLRNRSVAFRMGARRLSGLVGNVTIPRQSAGATAVWLANEASTITESQQTLQQVSLSPKTVGAYTEISRQLMLQSSPAAEGLVTADLAAVTALAVDTGVISGSGGSGQPQGIIGTSGVGSVTGTSLGYAGVLEFQTDVASANVMPVAGGYATTPAVAALMMARQRFSSTDTPLWSGNLWDGSMAGFPAMSTMQIPTADMLFGDWAQVVVAEWGVLQIDVNPFANFQAGIIGIRAITTMDVALRYGAAFSLATSIT